MYKEHHLYEPRDELAWLWGTDNRKSASRHTVTPRMFLETASSLAFLPLHVVNSRDWATTELFRSVGGALSSEKKGPPQGRIQGGFVGLERTPLFTDLFDLLVLLLLPACLTLSACVPVLSGYCIISVQSRALISRTVYSVKLVICSIFLRVELASA